MELAAKYSRFTRMEDGCARYEVFFAIEPAVSHEVRGTFRWSWVQMRADGLVTVRGQTFPSLSTALGAAAAYRRDHGGGAICVNIQETHRRDADDVIHLPETGPDDPRA